MSNIYEKLTHKMTQTLDSAVSLALHNKNPEVDVAHMIWALLTDSSSILNQALNKMGIDKAPIELEAKSTADKLAKVSSITKENIKISDLIEKARDLIAYTLRVDGIKLNITIKDNITMDLHTNDVVQVILNIVRNARDALMSKKQDRKEINLIAYKEGTNFIIQISDNAGGIPEDIMKKIFDPYFTTHHQSQGKGLGLYISKHIIQNSLNGEIFATNGKYGAIFTIKIPI